MAHAYKCDRCKKLYEMYPGVKLINGGYGYTQVAWSHNDSCNTSNWRDLCPECMQELIDWFNTPIWNNQSDNKEEDDATT